MAKIQNTLNKHSDAPSSGVWVRWSKDAMAVMLALSAVFLVVALLSFQRGDPAWSTTGEYLEPRNWGGQLGAHMADFLYGLAGASIWWLVGAGLWAGVAVVRRLFSRADSPELNARQRGFQQAMAGEGGHAAWWGPLRGMVVLTAALALVVASATLEWMRLYPWDAWLPSHAGGWLGSVLGPKALHWLGSTGSALFTLSVMVLAMAWVFGFSWGQWSEGLGERLENAWTARREAREKARDGAIGAAAQKARGPDRTDRAQARTEPAMGEGSGGVARDWDDLDAADASPAKAGRADRGGRVHEPSLGSSWDGAEEPPFDPPFDVEPSKLKIQTAPIEVPQSVRVAKEKQKPLFHDMPDSTLPQVSLLDSAPSQASTVSPETLEMTSRLIEKKLGDFGVQVSVVAAQPGPVITRYEIEPATGVKGSQVVNLARDLARSLSLVSIRVIETIPGKNLMALELPNVKRQTIKLSEILGSAVYNDAKSLLTMGLGKDIAGQPVVADLAKMPHCLVAGTTGSGKSVGINAMILSLLYKADAKDVRLLLIDPKMLELSVYEGIPHLLAPVVTDMKQAAHGLNWCVGEMEKRYKLMSKLGVRNLAGYNAKIDEAVAKGEIIGNPFSLTPEQPEPLDRMPYIVVVIDELADLMMVVGKKIEELIARLAQKARAAGIHLILATQRPSVDVITGLIKANIPTRLSFQVSSKIDSRTILDQMGAESLLGMGDMLYLPSGTGYPTRVHGAFVSDDEVHRVVAYLKEQAGEPDYIEGVLEGAGGDGEGGDIADMLGGGADGEKDPLYDQAVAIVLQDRKASISYVQRKLKIGYNRSARLLEDMENAGLVSALTSNGQREVLVPGRGGEA